jgi:uncharacterized protein YjbI with pentapeptide repeats
MAGAILHGTTLRGADLGEADLRRADLRGANMSGADLDGSQLGGAVYDSETVFPHGFAIDDIGMYFLGPGARLARIDLRGFEFRGQDLTLADLSHANLLGADLRGADLTGADLTGARIRRALYDHETRFPAGFEPTLSGAYAVVPGATIVSAKLQWKHLREVVLTGACLRGADLTGVDLSGANLDSVDLSRAILHAANVAGASLQDAKLHSALLKGAVLRGADMRRADIRGADLSWANLAEADLRGADMAGTLLSEALLRGARYNGSTTFPSAFDPSTARMVGGEGGGDGAPLRMSAPTDPKGSRALHRTGTAIARRSAAAARAVRLAAERTARTAGAALVVRVLTSPLAWFSLSASVTLAAAVWTGDLRWPHEPVDTQVTPEQQTIRVPPPPTALTFVRGAPTIHVARAPANRSERTTLVTAARANPGTSRVHSGRHRVEATRPSTVAVSPARPRRRGAVVMIPGAAPIPMPGRALPVRPVASATAAVAVTGGVASIQPVAVAPAEIAEAATAAATDGSPTTPTVEIGADLAIAPAATTPANEAVLVAAPDVRRVHDSEITEVVEAWRNAWERRDLDAYVGLYHASSATTQRRLTASTRRDPRFSKARLQARATDLFSQYGRIEVNVGSMDVRREGRTIVSTFDQDFVAWRMGSDAAPAYVDRGRKTLVFAQDDSREWRIVSEEWRQLAH